MATPSTAGMVRVCAGFTIDYISQTHITPTKDMQSFTGTTKRTRP